MKIEIPSLDKFLKDAKPWGINRVYWAGKWHENYKFYDQQRTNPDVKSLLASLGLKKNQKVLCVAGHKATWALALAKAGVKVTYSELSKELVDYVRRKVKHKNIIKYMQADYILYPSKPNEFDWSFTFEAVGPKEFILLLSMLNVKGGKYVIWNQDEHAKRKLKKLLKTVTLCKKLYPIKTSIILKNILSNIRNGEKKRRKHNIITIYTNDAAKDMILLDLKLLHHFSNKQRSSINELCKTTSRSEMAIKESLKRIESWGSLFEKKFMKKVIVT